jgi:hypothetical protein
MLLAFRTQYAMGLPILDSRELLAIILQLAGLMVPSHRKAATHTAARMHLAHLGITPFDLSWSMAVLMYLNHLPPATEARYYLLPPQMQIIEWKSRLPQEGSVSLAIPESCATLLQQLLCDPPQRVQPQSLLPLLWLAQALIYLVPRSLRGTLPESL